MKDELIVRAMRGDSAAFAELFSEVQSELYRVAYLYMKNREDALDVVQETAYRCYKNISTLKNGGYFKTWAVKTAINCSLNMLRKHRDSVSIDQLYEIEELSSTPDDAAVAKVTLERLMLHLDEREKSVLLLKYLYGLTLNEISKTLKIPLGTVKTVLYRAIDKMIKEKSDERNS